MPTSASAKALLATGACILTLGAAMLGASGGDCGGSCGPAAFGAPAAAEPSAAPSELAEPPPSSPSPSAEPAASESPSPTPSPVPVQIAPASVRVLLGHQVSVHLTSPASGLVQLGGFDPAVIRPIFNPIDRSIDITGLHVGSTTISVTSEAGLSSPLAVTVEASAGRTFQTTEITITGDPASADFVAVEAAHAATLVAYPEPGARVFIDPAAVRDAHTLSADQVGVVHVPVSITGEGYLPYQQTVAVRVVNVAQPRVTAKFLMVSDFPETITENGTLFYADVNSGEPARLLYYHYEPPHSSTRRLLVKVQNDGNDASLLQVIAGLAGPNPNILQVGHESTRRFLVHEAANEGEIFEVPPGAAINVIDQLLPADNLISGLQQIRVISGDGVRVAVVVQDAADSPVGPVSQTLLQSAVRHARGVYQVPDFFYDEYYTVGDAPTTLTIGKLPLPNLVQGEVLGGDYGVKQSATLTLLNPTDRAANVGLWFQPRGGRSTGTFFIEGQLLQLHPVNPGRAELLKTFSVPPRGYREVESVTMPEGGSSYPVTLIVSSQPPPGGGWSMTPVLY
ncbi:MAG: hypothetical protein M3T49_03990 [Candidatus Eremiobacteraeota bacterium]|nr:hypothetical protein [Candidatus Eremiobacteraeota bacterium]